MPRGLRDASRCLLDDRDDASQGEGGRAGALVRREGREKGRVDPRGAVLRVRSRSLSA